MSDSTAAFWRGIGLGAAAATAVVSSAALLYAYINKSTFVDGNAGAKTPKPSGRVKWDTGVPRPLQDTPALLTEQLSRVSAFFGEAGAKRIQEARIVVVGVGGVGSHAANMLARSGVGTVRLIDFDQVSLSSLNRHATATRDDVGTSKVSAMARTFSRIVPSCVVEPIQQLFEKEQARKLLLCPYKDGKFDESVEIKPTFVLDCIDDTATKADLLRYCYDNCIPVISSLGAGGKADPSRIHIADLSLIRTEAIAVALRKHMRKLNMCGFAENGGRCKSSKPTLGYEEPIDKTPSNGKTSAAAGSKKSTSAATDASKSVETGYASSGGDYSIWLSGIPCVFSSEDPRVELLPLQLNQGEKPQDFGALPGFRVRVIPVLGTMPAMFGQTLAAYVLCALAGDEHKIHATEQPPLLMRNITKIYGKFCELDRSEYMQPRASLSLDDVSFLIHDGFKQRSAITVGDRLGIRGCELVLCRWNRFKPSVPSNIVLVTDEQAAFLTRWKGSSLHEYVDAEYGAGTAAAVEIKLARIRSLGYD